jgi:hypothetical protein
MSFSISYWDLIKFPYYADTTKRGGERQGEDKVTLYRLSYFLLILVLTSNFVVELKSVFHEERERERKRERSNLHIPQFNNLMGFGR